MIPACIAVCLLVGYVLADGKHEGFMRWKNGEFSKTSSFTKMTAMSFSTYCETLTPLLMLKSGCLDIPVIGRMTLKSSLLSSAV